MEFATCLWNYSTNKILLLLLLIKLEIKKNLIMKKLKFNLLTGLLLLISVSVFAAGFPPPDKVQETFQKMYPKVTTVDWQRRETITLPISG